MANIKLSEKFPIYDITRKGILVGDVQANITACFEITFPIVFTLGDDEYTTMIEDFRKFIELLGDNILLHIQTFYHREYFSLINTDSNAYKNDTENFIERAYQMHFNERPYLKSKSYIYISQLPNMDTGIGSSLISKEFLKTDEQMFIDNILNSASILKKHNILLRKIEQEELLSPSSPISKYLNFSNADLEQLKDIDFSNNRIYVGSGEVKIYSIQSGEQFPTDNITYNKISNGLPICNIFPFSYSLGIPHILNQYIYVPNQKSFGQELDKLRTNLQSFNVKGANDNAMVDIDIFREKMTSFGSLGVYFHTNVMCFDASNKDIEERINTAFSETGFKKKEVTLQRKDIFWAGVAGNGALLVTRKKDLMCLLLDIEAVAYLSLEQNYNNSITSQNRGVRLCDRIYGIPFEVSIYAEPKKKGLIKNENTIVLAGSGGGKSFTMNLFFLNDYLQGEHIFIIDASFSYKLQCSMHNGVYLTYDERNKISFNPFYMDWLKDPIAKHIFTRTTKEQYEKLDEEIEISDDFSTEVFLSEEDTRKLEAYTDWLENKISMLLGLIGTITKSKEESVSKFELAIYRLLLFNYFKELCINNKVDNACFDDLYNFMIDFLPAFLKENNIKEGDFNFSKFRLMLSNYTTGNSFGYLLNSADEKIKNIEKERFVVIDVSRIRENPDLFPIISALAMDLYNQKVAKLPIGVKKILCIDEAWQAISSPSMATFMKTQVKVIRKYGGRTVFISQEPDDFTASEIIKESIINNSAVKIYLDMGEFKNKFEPIKKILAISDNNETKIKSLNINNRQDAKYREVCICWEGYGQVFAVETPLELKAIFETDPDEVAKILPQYEKYGVELTALNYANR